MADIKTCEALAVIKRRTDTGIDWDRPAVFNRSCAAQVDADGRIVIGECALEAARKVCNQSYSDRTDYVCLIHFDFSACVRT